MTETLHAAREPFLRYGGGLALSREHPRGGHVPGTPDGGLRSGECLGDVEALMAELAGDPAACLAARMAREHLEGGGKRLRARLALAAAGALGLARWTVVGWAAACELLHNATLVHDDLQDGDATRRGQPATWARYGPAQAVNAGDLLLMLPFLALERVAAAPERQWHLAAATARLAAEAARGQAAERALCGAPEPGWDAYRRAADGKAGALFQLPVEGAALLAGRAPAQARALAAPFRGLGVLFQLQDDVLDLYGDKGRGAPGADLREGKVSALVVEHLARHPADAGWLLDLLSLPRADTPQEGVDRAIRTFREGGALEGVMDRIAAEAHAVLDAPVLAAEPEMRGVATELARVALGPIAHVGGACR